MVASAAWRPASSIRSRRWACPRSATACATSTACSRKPSRTAARSRSPTTGCVWATRGRSSAPSCATRSASAAASAATATRPPLGAGRARGGAGLSTSSCRATPRERVSTLRQWSASAEGSIDFAMFCRGEHLAAGRNRLAADLLNWVLYPDDSTDAGRELRLKQEFLLVSASLQDMHCAPPARTRFAGRPGPAQRGAPERYAPGADAAELMRLLIDEHGAAVGQGLEHHAPGGLLHQPYPHARGAGKLAGAHVRGLAAAPPRDRLCDQPAHLDEVRAKFPGDDGHCRPLVADRRERRPPHSHGGVVDRRLAPGQRRFRRCTRT